MADRIRVLAPHNEDYDIVIEPGLLRDGKRLVADYILDKRVAIITNETIAPHHAERLAAVLPDAVVITMADGEAHKHMGTVTALCSDLAKAGVDRGSTVIALGGGVVGDTAGFVAASYMRGVRLVQVPTSLLAMVDSSVGGKVGVDLPEGKNLVGAFKQPAAVLIDPETLETLPDVEWRNGMAEVIKHGLIADPKLLEPAVHTRNNAAELVRRAVQVKVDVVQQDPYEHGVRQYLNLGHTFGHAIEHVTNFGVPHGQAVAMGMVAAAELSHRLGLCPADLPGHVRAILQDVGLPISVPTLSGEALWQAMFRDKKWRDGRSRFVLLEAIAKPKVIEDVDGGIVIKVLEELMEL